MPGRTLHLPEGTAERVLTLHREGWTTTPIAKELGVSRYLVKRTLRDAGVLAMSTGRPRGFTFDEHFFDKIDSQAKAYGGLAWA